MAKCAAASRISCPESEEKVVLNWALNVTNHCAELTDTTSIAPP